MHLVLLEMKFICVPMLRTFPERVAKNKVGKKIDIDTTRLALLLGEK